MLTGSHDEMKSYASALISRSMNMLVILSVLVVGPALLMGLIGLLAFSVSKGSETLMPLLMMLGGVVIPVLVLVLINWIYRGNARSLIYELREKEKDAVHQCCKELAQPAYFNAVCGANGGAIAVDPVSKKIALVFGQMQSSQSVNTQLITLNPGELRNWTAEKPGITTSRLVGSGHSSGEMMANHTHNLRQQHQQATGTGLRLATENLHATEIFISFDFDVAKSWVALLNKLDAGRLETLTASMEFPKPEKLISP